MKWITATIGAALVFVGATLALLLVPALVYPRLYESIPGLVAAYFVALPLGGLAAFHSFRATLAAHAKREVATVELDDLEEV